MVQQKILQNHQIKVYNYYLEFFQKSIGIIHPLREKIPHSEILEELNHSLKEGYREVGKAIIAKHALLSFFPNALRKNSLIHLYIHRKLMKGNSPLTNKSILAFLRYTTWEENKLKADIKRHSELAVAMLNAMEILLPENNFDFYFDNYLKLLNQWRESILDDDYVFLDALMDDFWISKNWMFSQEELNMLVCISELFDSVKIPFSLSSFQKHLQNNQELLLKKFESHRWITESQHTTSLWNKFANQGINFSYVVNTNKLGLRPCYFIIQVHPKTNIELLEFSFNRLKNLYFLFENWSQESPVYLGIMYVPQNDITNISRLFMRLKEIGTIQDYLLISGTKSLEKITYTRRLDSQLPDLYIKIMMESDTQSSYQMDCLDNIFLFYLRLTGFVSYPLNEISYFAKMIRTQIDTHISNLEKQRILYDSKEDLKGRSARNIVQLLPEYFYRVLPRTLEDCVLNLDASDIELLYFYDKCHSILSQIKKYEKFSDLIDLEYLKNSNSNLYITIDSEIRNLTVFIKRYYKNIINHSGIQDQYSIKSILQNLIKTSKDQIDDIVSDLTALLSSLTSRIDSLELDPQIIHDHELILQSLLSGSDEDLLKEFQARLKKYISLGLVTPQLFRSVVLGFNDYFECWIFPKNFPNQIRDYITARFRTFTHSIQENVLGNWDLDWGSQNPSTIEYLGSFLPKLPIQALSLIQTSYDTLYHYDSLYDFKNQLFPSLNPKMKSMLEFTQKYLRNNSLVKPDLLSDYLCQKNVKNLVPTFKSIPGSNMRRCNDFAYSTPIDMMKNISQTMNIAREKDTLRFLEKESTSMRDIRIEVNWPRFGLEEYIVSFKVRKDEFTHNSIDSVLLTREFMCLPGIKEIYSSTNTGYFHTYFIHYLFPFNSPAKNVFRTLERWGYIGDLTIIKIRSKDFWFNSQFLEDSITKFNSWELFAYRHITSNVNIVENTPISYSYNPGNKFLGPNTSEFQIISTIYDKNIRKLRNLPIFFHIHKLFHLQLIWFIPDSMKIYPLPHRLIIQLYPVDSRLADIFIGLFMTVPLSIIYKVEYEKNNRNVEGLFVDLRFHPCNLSEFLFSIRKIIQFLKVEYFRITPSIVPLTANQFAGSSLRNYPDLFRSFIWDNNQFKNIKYFNRSGPLTYKERYNQLK